MYCYTAIYINICIAIQHFNYIFINLVWGTTCKKNLMTPHMIEHVLCAWESGSPDAFRNEMLPDITSNIWRFRQCAELIVKGFPLLEQNQGVDMQGLESAHNPVCCTCWETQVFMLGRAYLNDQLLVVWCIPAFTGVTSIIMEFLDLLGLWALGNTCKRMNTLMRTVSPRHPCPDEKLLLATKLPHDPRGFCTWLKNVTHLSCSVTWVLG